MPFTAQDFDLVPVDVVAVAIRHGESLETQGFSVEAEPFDLEFPSTPVFRATRNDEVRFYEIATTIDMNRAAEWAKYGKASPADTKYVAVVPDSTSVVASDLARLRELGVGVESVGPTGVITLCAAHDLSLNAEFPSVPKQLTASLNHARELFGQGSWKESYEDACQALETLAREYIVGRSTVGTCTFRDDKGKAISFKKEQIEKQTLGQLAKTFAYIEKPTQIESRVGQALKRINPNRVTVAHFKNKTGKRADDLRSAVGRDLIVIVNSMKMLDDALNP